MLDFEGKTVLLIGASGALPPAVAGLFADLGASLLLVDRAQAPLDRLRPRLKRAAGVVAAKYDLRDPQQIEAVFALAGDQLGGVDIVITGTSLAQAGPAAEADEIAWRRELREAMEIMVMVNRAAVLALRADGHVVNILPVAEAPGAVPHPSLSGARGYARDFTIALAREVAPRGLRVNGVAPGQVPASAEVPGGARGAMAEGVAGAVVLLSSPLASHINGVILPVDDGLGDGPGWR